MYYMYMQNRYGVQGYPGKSEPYLHHAGNSISPTKNQHKILDMPVNMSPVKSIQPYLPVHYHSQQSSDGLLGVGNKNAVSSGTEPLKPLEIKEN